MEMDNYISVKWSTSKEDLPTDMYAASCRAERGDEMVCACAVMVRNVIEALAKHGDKKTETERALEMIVAVLNDDAAKIVEGTTIVMPNGALPHEQ